MTLISLTCGKKQRKKTYKQFLNRNIIENALFSCYSRNMSATNDLTNKILAFLFSHGVFAWRNNTQGVLDSRSYTRRSATKTGVADIIAVLSPAGRILAIEIKTGSDKMTDVQVGFQANIEKMGGVYIVARDFVQFMAAWHDVHEWMA